MMAETNNTHQKLPWATQKSSLVLRLECLLVFLISMYVFRTLGGSWWLFAGVIAAIDITLVGYLINNHIGGLVYNIGHSYILPRCLLLGALIFQIEPLILVTIAWNAHISLDRAFGYGLKHESFHLTHLGPIGKHR